MEESGMKPQIFLIERIFPNIEILLNSLSTIGIKIIEKDQDEKKLIKIIEILKRTGIEIIKKIPDDYFEDENKKILVNSSIDNIEELFNSRYFTENNDIKIIQMVILIRESINSISKIGLYTAKIKNFYSIHKDETNSSSFIEIIINSLHEIGIYAAQKKYDNVVKHVFTAFQYISNSAFDTDIFDISEIEFPSIEEICTKAIMHGLESTMKECAYILQGIGFKVIEIRDDKLLIKILKMYNIIGEKAIRNNISTKMDILSSIKTIYMESLFTDFNEMIFSSYNTYLELSYQNNLDEVTNTIKDNLHEMRLEAVKKNNIEIINGIDNLLKK
jgi:hypothetical protein